MSKSAINVGIIAFISIFCLLILYSKTWNNKNIKKTSKKGVFIIKTIDKVVLGIMSLGIVLPVGGHIVLKDVNAGDKAALEKSLTVIPDVEKQTEVDKLDKTISETGRLYNQFNQKKEEVSKNVEKAKKEAEEKKKQEEKAKAEKLAKEKADKEKTKKVNKATNNATKTQDSTQAEEETTEVAYQTPTEKLYSLQQFMFSGVVNWGGYKFTYYSQSVLPGGGLVIPGRHVNRDGYVADKDGYIVLAGSAPKGTVYETPFGYKGKIYDRGTYGNHLDVYIR